MLEALAISVLGSFFYDNVEFFKTVKEQKVDTNGNGDYKDRNPDVPPYAVAI